MTFVKMFVTQHKSHNDRSHLKLELFIWHDCGKQASVPTDNMHCSHDTQANYEISIFRSRNNGV